VQSSGANSQEVRHLNFFLQHTIRTLVYDANRRPIWSSVQRLPPAQYQPCGNLGQVADGGFVPRDPG
jgi:hypothetical protein